MKSYTQHVVGYEFEGFVLDSRRRIVWRHDGTQVRLTARLFNMLLLFVERPGELLDKNWLMDTLWPGMIVGENSLSQLVCSLRRALAREGRGYVQTESRHGFRFVCQVKTLPQWQPEPGAGAGSLPASMETLSAILALHVVIMRQLAETLAPHLSDAAP